MGSIPIPGTNPFNNLRVLRSKHSPWDTGFSLPFFALFPDHTSAFSAASNLPMRPGLTASHNETTWRVIGIRRVKLLVMPAAVVSEHFCRLKHLSDMLVKRPSGWLAVNFRHSRLRLVAVSTTSKSLLPRGGGLSVFAESIPSALAMTS